jgi:hypothetical protein
VSRDEFQNYVEKIFKDADPDNDGTVDEKELSTKQGKSLQRLIQKNLKLQSYLHNKKARLLLVGLLSLCKLKLNIRDYAFAKIEMIIHAGASDNAIKFYLCDRNIAPKDGA